MSSDKEHMEYDKLLFNRAYPEVHEWIDSTFSEHRYRNPYAHWLNCHHAEALVERYSGEELNSAYMHVLVDWLTHFGAFVVPKNKKEVIEHMESGGVL